MSFSTTEDVFSLALISVSVSVAKKFTSNFKHSKFDVTFLLQSTKFTHL